MIIMIVYVQLKGVRWQPEHLSEDQISSCRAGGENSVSVFHTSSRSSRTSLCNGESHGHTDTSKSVFRHEGNDEVVRECC